ncbi:MAG: hypothetical protein N2D54_11130, partial [Chloroflexota bacterium]
MMLKHLMITLTLVVIAFSSAAQESSEPIEKPNSNKTNSSGDSQLIKLGKLPRQDEVSVLETRLKYFLDKIDTTARAGSTAGLQFRIRVARNRLKDFNELNGGFEIRRVEAPSWWRDIPHPERGACGWCYPPMFRYPNKVDILMRKWMPKYKKYLQKKFGPGPEPNLKMLRAQIWNWLAPQEKAELNAKIYWLEKDYARALKSIREIRDKLAKIKAATDDERIPKEDMKKYNKDKKGETNKERKQPLIEKPEAGEERVVEADEGGMLVGKSLKPSDFEGCGAAF